MFNMTKSISLGIAIAAASSSYATGGFLCAAETHSGKKISVGGCIPHSIDGLCSDLMIYIDDKKIEIPRDQVPSFYVGSVNDSALLALSAYDSELSEKIVDLAFQGKKGDDKIYQGLTKGSYARLIIKDAGKTYSFKDVSCLLE